jgi:hypothetical protein
MISFVAIVSIINGNPYVRPPDKVLNFIFIQANKETGPIPVQGKINGAPFTQSLVRYQGDWRLYVNIIMAKAAGIKFTKSISEIMGTRISFEIGYNSNPPVFDVPKFLKDALVKSPRALSAFEKLIPSRKKEINRYFSWIKSDEAKERNLKKLMSVLEGTEDRFMARSWKNGK